MMLHPARDRVKHHLPASHVSHDAPRNLGQHRNRIYPAGCTFAGRGL